MTDFAMWSLIAGACLPPVLAVIQQQHWRQQFRAAVAFLACTAVGAATAYFQGSLTGKRWVEAALIIGVAALSTYHGFWKPSGIAPKIEAATSPR